MASKLLLLPQSEYAPYLSLLPPVSLPASWEKEELEQLQCEYMIQKVGALLDVEQLQCEYMIQKAGTMAVQYVWVCMRI